ncbi:helix-turn-helix transcriptional regulator [Novilysobacter erysipheiresistens]|uniref:ArsR family transcriptional regulator n=1 Tax=Novilysobacter erysipheiresistens TaxID=1749332 RepID=A0ABU7YZ46_9GAMM
MGRLRQFGSSRQKLLRVLLQAPQGSTVGQICDALRLTHNAVRQHLAALISMGLVAHGHSRATGGRPQACYLLTAAGRDLFPRNYDLIAGKVIEHLLASAGPAKVQELLAVMGRELGSAAAAATVDGGDAGDDAVAISLADQLEALGYEAQAVRHGDELQVEAHNCVFHALAQQHPEVCHFDLAFMQAASGRPIQHMECLVRGGRACRFRIGPRQLPE